VPDAISPDHSSYCITLQPFCDSFLKHVGDELLYRSTGEASNAIFDDPMTATARVCTTAFYETGVKALSGNRLMFFNAPREWLIKPELMPHLPVINALKNPEVRFHEVEQLLKQDPDLRGNV
jgi:EAL and modified HD-GYP domain-containing signal transduction protein